MAFRAKMARAQYFDPKIQNKAQEISRLEKSLYEDKYYDLHDHLYYAMGKIAERSGEKKRLKATIKKPLSKKTQAAQMLRGIFIRVWAMYSFLICSMQKLLNIMIRR